MIGINQPNGSLGERLNRLRLTLRGPRPSEARVAVSREEVERNFRRYGLLDDRVRRGADRAGRLDGGLLAAAPVSPHDGVLPLRKLNR